jgi:hypothetical protein
MLMYSGLEGAHGVPTASMVLTSVVRLATPKSANLTWPSLVTRMFAPLISRCMTPYPMAGTWFVVVRGTVQDVFKDTTQPRFVATISGNTNGRLKDANRRRTWSCKNASPSRTCAVYKATKGSGMLPNFFTVVARDPFSHNLTPKNTS